MEKPDSPEHAGNPSVSGHNINLRVPVLATMPHPGRAKVTLTWEQSFALKLSVLQVRSVKCQTSYFSIRVLSI